MALAAMLINAFHAALENAVEIFDGVGMGVPANIFTRNARSRPRRQKNPAPWPGFALRGIKPNGDAWLSIGRYQRLKVEDFEAGGLTRRGPALFQGDCEASKGHAVAG
jgi:hypothetical protein